MNGTSAVLKQVVYVLLLPFSKPVKHKIVVHELKQFSISKKL
jgi:hypothetical protein